MPLLSAVIKRQAMPARLKKVAQKLLDAFPGYGQPTAPQAADETAGLVEPLTPREIEVLLLIAAGDANQTIADKLVITTRTVKKHTGNIYGKLNVSSRTQAVARARRLGLLPLSWSSWAVIGWLAMVNTALAFTLWNIILRILT